MKKKEEESNKDNPFLKEFSARLGLAMDHAGHPGRGGQTWLGQTMGVTQTSARRWLVGTAFPELEKVPILADLLGVRLEWLMTGQGKMIKETREPTWIPLIAWGDIPRWLSPSREAVSKIDDYPFPGPVGQDTFVVSMQGSSMEPDITNGDLVVIDPGKPWSDQDLVLASAGPGTETIRKLEMDGGKPVLFLSNLNYPSRTDSERTRILGTVVGKIKLYRE